MVEQVQSQLLRPWSRRWHVQGMPRGQSVTRWIDCGGRMHGDTHCEHTKSRERGVYTHMYSYECKRKREKEASSRLSESGPRASVWLSGRQMSLTRRRNRQIAIVTVRSVAMANVSVRLQCIQGPSPSHANIYMYIYIYIYIYVNTYTCMHACMHARLHTYIHTHTHTYKQTCIENAIPAQGHCICKSGFYGNATNGSCVACPPYATSPQDSQTLDACVVSCKLGSVPDVYVCECIKLMWCQVICPMRVVPSQNDL